MIELKQHPAQARHPVTNDPLWDDDGNPRPLLPSQRSVVWDGAIIGYASKNGIAFTLESSKVPDWVRDEAKALVEKEFNSSRLKISTLIDSLPEEGAE
jgi:hypothetical protein